MSHTLLIIGVCMVGFGAFVAYFAALYEMLRDLRVAVKARDWSAAGRELIAATVASGLGVLGASLVTRYLTGAY